MVHTYPDGDRDFSFYRNPGADMTGEEDYTAGVNWIRERYQIPLILVSMGKEGSRADRKTDRSSRDMEQSEYR